MQFKSIRDYYAADYENRERSPEIDYGVWWRLAGMRTTYRVTYVEKSRELITIDQNTDRVLVLAYFDNRAEVEHALKGWAEQCGKHDSLAWVIEQIANDCFENLALNRKGVN